MRALLTDLRGRHGVLCALIAILCAGPACTSSASPPPRELVTVTRTVGTWQGTGPKTIGDVMLESGRFRVTWETRDETAPGSGTFLLTARSSVSGRPLEVIADHRGVGRGSVEMADERRVYDFTIESANVQWSFTVDDLVAVDANAPSAPLP